MRGGLSRLKSFRQEMKLSQKDFANSIGLNLSTYNNYETGAREPNSDFWIAISQKYNVSIDFLLGLSDKRYSNTDKKVTDENDTQEKLLLKNYASLNQEGRERLCNYSDDLVSSGRYTKNNKPDFCADA